MTHRSTYTGLEFGLALSVLVLAGLILWLGWAQGVDQLVRLTPDGNAIVPGTALCLALVAFASLPLHSVFHGIQQMALMLALLALGAMSLISSFTGHDAAAWLTFEATPQDGMSASTKIGIFLTIVSAALRHGMLKSRHDWAFHLPFLGFIACSGILALVAIDPLTSNLVPLFHFLSPYTALLLSLLFAAQMIGAGMQDPVADDVSELLD